MNSTPLKRVAINSVWLIIQPLALNLISLFVTALVARKLGPNDYGIFVFALAFISMFSPIINLGLRAVMVRAIAEDKNSGNERLGKMIVIRSILGCVAISLIYISLLAFDYPQTTIRLTMLASLIIFFQALTSAFHDYFQAFEKMQYIAATSFLSGITLSICTIITVLLGGELDDIILVYVLCNCLAPLLCIYYQWKYFTLPKLGFDYKEFVLEAKQGFPFLVPSILYGINSRLGVLLISKFGGNSHVAIYGAATNLTDKLLVVPDGIGTSIFPTISALGKENFEEAVELFRHFCRYIFLLGFPLAVGTTTLSENIINLIYGSEYSDSANILAILIWGTFFQFILSIYDWTLNALHKEKYTAYTSLAAMPIFIIPCYLLTKEYGYLGAAVAFSCFQGFKLFLMGLLVRKFITKRIYPKTFILRSLIAVALLWAIVEYTKDINIVLSIFCGIIVFGMSIVALKLIPQSEINTIRQHITKLRR